MIFNSERNKIQFVDDDTDVIRVIRNITKSGIQNDSFYVLNVLDLIQKYDLWKTKLFRVLPYYTVKYNDNSFVLKILSSLGAGFKCVSKEEVRKILASGVDSSRIIFTNATKSASHIQYASKEGIEFITFDDKNELYKIKALNPSAKLILQIRNDEADQYSLGITRGCNIFTEAPGLLHLAQSLNLYVIGISFYVGSSCNAPEIYRRMIGEARTLFTLGKELGFDMQLINLGECTFSDKDSSIDVFADTINEALDEYFPIENEITVIAEPGRYLITSALTLAARIISKREITDSKTNLITNNIYYINDGIYGSFNSLLYDNIQVQPLPLFEIHSCELMPCSIWGPSCDNIDLIFESRKFPILNAGDWIIFENMGAYTLSTINDINGFPITKMFSVLNESAMLSLKNTQEAVEDFDLAECSKLNLYQLDENWIENEQIDPLFQNLYDLNENCTVMTN